MFALKVFLRASPETSFLAKQAPLFDVFCVLGVLYFLAFEPKKLGNSVERMLLGVDLPLFSTEELLFAAL